MMVVWRWLKKTWVGKLLGQPGRAAWGNSGTWLLWGVVGGFLPIWGGMIVLKLTSQEFRFNDFVRHGEFALYSASLLGGTLWLITKDWKGPGYKGRGLMCLFSVAILMISSLIFACVTAASMNIGSPLARIDEEFLFRSSVLMLTITGILSFVATIMDEAKWSKFNVPQVLNSGAEQLNKEFDATQQPPQ